MKTLYAACLARLGLSQPEAATLHGSRLDTVKSWASGRNPIPPGIWTELRAYEASIIDRSEAIRESWEDAGETSGTPIDARFATPVELMALADLVLSADVAPNAMRAQA